MNARSLTAGAVLAFAFGLLALTAGCEEQAGAFAFVTVDIDPAVGDAAVYQLRSVAENGSESDEALFPATPGERLTFPKSYIIELGKRTGALRLRVEGLASDGAKVLVRATTQVEIKPGGQVSLPVRLKRACAATSYCKDVPGGEALRLLGTEATSRAGNAVAAAPLSGGPADDLIVGAYQMSRVNVAAQGEVYVLFGPRPGDPLMLQTDTVDVLVSMQCPKGDACVVDGTCGAGETCAGCPEDCGPCELPTASCDTSTLGNAILATPLAAGGPPALVIASAGSGAVYVVPGPFAAAAKTLELKLGDRAKAAVAYTIITGVGNDAHFGRTLAVADVVGDDGQPDLVVGAPLFSPDGARAKAGAVFVIPNALLGTGAVDLGADPLPDGVVVIHGAAAGENLGAALAVGDILGGDGKVDLVIGAPLASPASRSRAGAVYVVAGPFAPGVRDLATSPADLVIQGAEASDMLGTAVAAGDLTGEGDADLVLGVPAASTVYLLAGPLPAGSPRDLAVAGDYQSAVRNGGVAFGTTVVLADLSGDDVMDLLIGAPGSTSEPGRLVVLRGGTALPPDLDFQGKPTDVAGADVVITGVAGDGLGGAAAVVDTAVDTAGAREILVGAPQAAAAFYVLRAE